MRNCKAATAAYSGRLAPRSAKFNQDHMLPVSIDKPAAAAATAAAAVVLMSMVSSSEHKDCKHKTGSMWQQRQQTTTAYQASIFSSQGTNREHQQRAEQPKASVTSSPNNASMQRLAVKQVKLPLLLTSL
jgi:hypothetical protein